MAFIKRPAKNLPLHERDKLIIFPDRFVFQRIQIDLIYCYREYFAFRAYGNKVLNETLVSDYLMKTFQNIVNCVHTNEVVSLFWSRKIFPKLSFPETRDIKEHREVYQRLENLLNQFYILFNNKGFRFFSSDPTQSSFCFELGAERDNLVSQALQLIPTEEG